ncbi:ETHYLENE INSENSITIVE 3-like 3 protein [Prunus yedoensis var. nudiflora]|uniref:ETHYLENE INSENSITIVE 3-like 3 protein n=1 Tax=Prunus yedoensis var. nudiflora TaxID=2094558 RepID=A0A314ZUQ5_PRUYE|nr:ETHYLENE INSENSITIVE 3-like 3 protein [Prunus yedoensis var. nudiflora]
MDLEPSSNLCNNTPNHVQDKEQGEKQPRPKRPRIRASPVEQLPAPSRNENIHLGPRNDLPDINHTDVQMIGFQVRDNQQENGTITTLRPLEKDLDIQAQLPASEFNYYSAVPSTT